MQFEYSNPVNHALRKMDAIWANAGPERSPFPKGYYEYSLSSAQLKVTPCPDYLARRGYHPIVFSLPILSKGIDAFRPWVPEAGIEPNAFSVVPCGEPINRERTLYATERYLKVCPNHRHRWICWDNQQVGCYPVGPGMGWLRPCYM